MGFEGDHVCMTSVLITEKRPRKTMYDTNWLATRINVKEI